MTKQIKRNFLIFLLLGLSFHGCGTHIRGLSNLLAGAGVKTNPNTVAINFDPSLTATGNLVVRISDTTLVSLANFDVVVAGGVTTGGTVTATSEIFSAASGTWAATGSMNVARVLSAGVRLNDGSVLVVGGYNDGAATGLTSAELFNPDTNLWTVTGSLIGGRNRPLLGKLADGRALVTGGASVGLTATSTSELYDPIAGTWSATGSMNAARTSSAGVILNSGKFLAIGGFNGATLATCELYDPTLGTWTYTGSMSQARYLHAAVVLPTGNVLVMGGYPGAGLNGINSVELYDTVAGTWSTKASMNLERYNFSATLLPNGSVIVAGGFPTSTTQTNTVELYDPVGDTWTTLTGTLAEGVGGNRAITLGDGRALFVGGTSTGPIYTNSTSLLSVYASIFLSATGGVTPYTHSLISGSGKVYSSAGFYVPSQAGAETAEVRVISADALSYDSVTVTTY